MNPGLLQDSLVDLASFHKEKFTQDSSLKNCLEVWVEKLREFPLEIFKNFVLDTIQFGAKIFYHGPRPASRKIGNHKTTNEEKLATTRYILEERKLGRILGPFSTLPDGVSVSPMGIVPKDEDKFRITTDLSSPPGLSINDGISPDDVKIKYVGTSDIVDMIESAGTPCWLWKCDLKSAYRHVAISDEDSMLQGVEWFGMFFVDLFLPFGLRSAPFIFSAIAAALAWIATQDNSDLFLKSLLHYLDDFFGAQKTREGAHGAVSRFKEIAESLGFHINPKKTEIGQVITILGNSWDTQLRLVRITDKRRAKYHNKLVDLLSRKSVRIGTLQEVAGCLECVAQLLWFASPFRRQFYDRIAGRSHHKFVSIDDTEFRKEVIWWLGVLHDLPGLPFDWIKLDPETTHDVILFSDASTSYGGGVFCAKRWFQLCWKESDTFCKNEKDIQVLEMFMVVAAALTWGSEWRGKAVLFWIDNQSDLYANRRGKSGNKLVLDLLKTLAMLSLTYHFKYAMKYIPSEENAKADHLSRFPAAGQWLRENDLDKFPVAPIFPHLGEAFQLSKQFFGEVFQVFWKNYVSR